MSALRQDMIVEAEGLQHEPLELTADETFVIFPPDLLGLVLGPVGSRRASGRIEVRV